jgi:hypothetical protein
MTEHYCERCGQYWRHGLACVVYCSQRCPACKGHAHCCVECQQSFPCYGADCQDTWDSLCDPCLESIKAQEFSEESD